MGEISFQLNTVAQSLPILALIRIQRPNCKLSSSFFTTILSTLEPPYAQTDLESGLKVRTTTDWLNRASGTNLRYFLPADNMH